jgi:uncharacterized membrane protein YoaK (UPF0700 family)
VRERLSDVTTGLYLITAICGGVDAVCFLARGQVLGGRLLRGPKKIQEWRIGFAVERSTPAGGDNRNWQRRMLSMGLFLVSAAIGTLLLQFGVVWPLVAASLAFTLAMFPVLWGDHQSK